MTPDNLEKQVLNASEGFDYLREVFGMDPQKYIDELGKEAQQMREQTKRKRELEQADKLRLKIKEALKQLNKIK